MEWIKCSEGIPVFENEYYIVSDGKTVTSCKWTGKFWQNSRTWEYPAKYWMPLPEPPKENE